MAPKMRFSGSLLVHKASHHFDQMNWWLDAEPEEVHAFGDVAFYGHNNSFRSKTCRGCAFAEKCAFHWDITTDEHLMNLYVKNEQYDGYIRDNCLFRREINIYDKMSAQIKYANNVVVNYSLTTYSPYEGWKIAFNGIKGRIEAWQDIPFIPGEDLISQEDMHKAEMDQESNEELLYKPVILHKLWNRHETIVVGHKRGGHGGGDDRLHNKLFKDPTAPDPYKHAAGTRDGAMSILIGVAARKSIESGRPIRIAELTDLEPRKQRI